jgi:hypothetical protein
MLVGFELGDVGSGLRDAADAARMFASDRRTRVAVVMRDGIDGPVHTAFEQSKPNPRWNPMPFGSGK